MFETIARNLYHVGMKRLSAKSIIQQSTVDILDSLDMRASARPTTVHRSRTTESAWRATGAYLWKALKRYEHTRTTRTR